MIQRMLAIWSLLQLLKSNHRPFTNKGAWLCPSKTLLTKQAVSDFANPSLRAAAAAKSLQSCPTLCDLVDSSPPGSSVPGILQAKTVEWVAISFSNAWKWKVKVKLQSCPTLCDPMDCSLPSSSIHGIFQARVLESVAIVFSITEAGRCVIQPNSNLAYYFFLISVFSNFVCMKQN